ncbi:TOX high mobility group box family member 2, partial [Homo sapiens]
RRRRKRRTPMSRRSLCRPTHSSSETLRPPSRVRTPVPLSVTCPKSWPPCGTAWERNRSRTSRTSLSSPAARDPAHLAHPTPPAAGTGTAATPVGSVASAPAACSPGTNRSTSPNPASLPSLRLAGRHCSEPEGLTAEKRPWPEAGWPIGESSDTPIARGLSLFLNLPPDSAEAAHCPPPAQRTCRNLPPADLLAPG